MVIWNLGLEVSETVENRKVAKVASTLAPEHVWGHGSARCGWALGQGRGQGDRVGRADAWVRLVPVAFWLNRK